MLDMTALLGVWKVSLSPLAIEWRSICELGALLYLSLSWMATGLSLLLLLLLSGPVRCMVSCMRLKASISLLVAIRSCSRLSDIFIGYSLGFLVDCAAGEKEGDVRTRAGTGTVRSTSLSSILIELRRVGDSWHGLSCSLLGVRAGTAGIVTQGLPTASFVSY